MPSKTRHCDHCGKKYQAKTIRSRYCDPNCPRGKSKSKTNLYWANAAGEGAILTAVIALAVRDASGSSGTKHIASGRRYLASSIYRNHLGLLGLPEDWLPSPEGLQ